MKFFKVVAVMMVVLFVQLVNKEGANAQSNTFGPGYVKTGIPGTWVDLRGYSSLNVALAAIVAAGAPQVTLAICTEHTVAINTTIPANVALYFTSQGGFNVTAGTLTVSSRNIFAEDRSIFRGAGTINFAVGTQLRSSWFTTIDYAIAQTVNDTVSLVVSAPATFAASAAVGANVRLVFESPGNILTVPIASTLSNIDQVVAGKFQCFGGAGDFSFVNGPELRASWFDHLRSAVIYIGTDVVTLVNDVPEILFANLVIPATTTFKVDRGAIIDLDAYTFAIGLFECGLYQAFNQSGVGVVTFGAGAVEKVYPRWWGANTIHAAILAIGATPTELFLDDDITLTAHETIPATLKLRVISPANVITLGAFNLTINGPFEAPVCQVFAQAGAGVVTFGTGVVKKVYPEWWGAVGDGVADDTAEIQDAIDSLISGGTVRFNETATYKITSSIEGKISGLVLQGNGAKLIKCSDDIHGVNIYGTSVAHISDVRIENLIVDGDNRGTSGSGIVIQYSDHSVISGCYSYDNPANGIYVGGTGVNLGTGNRVEGNWSYNNGAFGIIMIGQNDPICQGNWIDGNSFAGANDGIQIKNSTGFNVIGNRIKNTTESGINIRCSSNGSDVYGSLLGNIVEDATENSYYIHHDSANASTGEIAGIAVTGNQSFDPGWSDYAMAGESGHPIKEFTFTGNTGTGAASHGVSITYASHGIITGNTIGDPDEYCMLLSGVKYCVFGNNVLRNPGHLGDDRDNVRLQNGADGTTYSIYNHFAGDVIIAGTYGSVGYRELHTDNCDYNTFGISTFQGYTNNLRYRPIGAHSRVIHPNYYTSNADVTTTGSGNLALYSCGTYELGGSGGIRVLCAGTKAGAGGNKTLLFSFGTVQFTVCVAANNTNDWRVEVEVFNTATNAQRFTWTAWDGATMTQGYETGAFDTTVASFNIGMTATLVSGTDSVTQTMFTIDRIQ